MAGYLRPSIETGSFHDESGVVIPYGARWRGPPPDDSYSRVSNPERFAPLQVVAHALVDHLRAEYLAEIAVLDDPEPRTTKLVTVTSVRADCAPLMLRFTDFPGVLVHAGVRYREAFPSCGCDACDETWDRVAEDLERVVLAVADGGFVERIAVEGDGSATVHYEFGRRSGATGRVPPDAGLRRDMTRLEQLPDARWQPWKG